VIAFLAQHVEAVRLMLDHSDVDFELARKLVNQFVAALQVLVHSSEPSLVGLEDETDLLHEALLVLLSLIILDLRITEFWLLTDLLIGKRLQSLGAATGLHHFLSQLKVGAIDVTKRGGIGVVVATQGA